jgi:hypothetical protein
MVVRDALVLVAPARPVFYLFFLIERGPDFNVPLNLRACSISLFVQKRMDRLPILTGFGATICPFLIQAKRVWRETPIFIEASAVV